MPRPAREPDRELARPTRTQPENATAQPANSRRGNPSRRKIPARSAIRIGPVLISIAAVPASTRRSASFRVTL
jgi:hypothetical protein